MFLYFVLFVQITVFWFLLFYSIFILFYLFYAILILSGCLLEMLVQTKQYRRT